MISSINPQQRDLKPQASVCAGIAQGGLMDSRSKRIRLHVARLLVTYLPFSRDQPVDTIAALLFQLCMHTSHVTTH